MGRWGLHYSQHFRQMCASAMPAPRAQQKQFLRAVLPDISIALAAQPHMLYTAI